ncbi:MAG TPA: hypothetical protein VFP34_14225 [Microlunatus sp.]|nr:hypothetical protein [Microlunatus sp.]
MTDSTAQEPTAGPQLPTAILIIRHGEKPPDNDGHPPSARHSAHPPFGVEIDGTQNAESLIPQGWQRAGGLATFFAPCGGTFTSPLVTRPTMIAVPHYADAPKHRTYQTVWPLAEKLGTEPAVTVPVGHESELASWLLGQAGQTVLVCWEHQHIEDLTTALGSVIAGGDVPGPWPSDRFDIVVALTADQASGDHYVCTQVPQLLLAGDSSQPIPGPHQPPSRG